MLETRWVLVADSLVRAAEEEERSVEPYHDRIREHVLHGLAPERLRARHGLLAEAHEREQSADAEILGFHYRGAGEVGKALLYTERAAELYGVDHPAPSEMACICACGRSTGVSRRGSPVPGDLASLKGSPGVGHVVSDRALPAAALDGP